jgi:putative spermidine/putrescine transport system permease protein
VTGPLRAALLAALAVSALGPFAVLAAWSVSGRWLFPALLPERLSGAPWRETIAGPVAPAAFTSLALAAATAVIATALALPVGRALSRLRGWRRHLGAAAAFLPVAAPPVALATGLQVALLFTGLGGTAAGVLVSHLVPAVGYLSLFFLGTFTLFDARVEEAARTLGAGPRETLRRVTLPLLRRPVAEAAAVGFLISWTQFALTLVVGAGAVRTLPLEVFALVRAGQDAHAAAGALLLTVPAVAMLAALRLAARRAGAVAA